MRLNINTEAPIHVRVFGDSTPNGSACERQGDDWHHHDVTVTLARSSGTTAVSVHAPRSPIARVAIRWAGSFPDQALYLGDAWERGYGDLQWRSAQPERVLPWYLAVHDPESRQTLAVGVKTQPAAMCFWTADPAGVTLWLDLHNGGMPSLPGDRLIAAATVVAAKSTAGETPMATIRRLCRAMCEKPRLAGAPVCGNNNWYYAYGRNFDANQVIRDANLLADLARGHANRPFCVVDAGWSPGSVCPGGPWVAGRPDKFPNMPRLAEAIRKTGVRPGIWIRPTALTTVTDPRRLRAGPQTTEEKALDLTLAENIESIRQDVYRMHAWGFDLIKHDFSTWDALGRWGFQMGSQLAEPGWHFAHRTLTNAEILRNVYEAIRDGAGDAMLIGCNTVGHIGAGLFEVQRTGDDTSGRV
ncbi:MAG TPA: hypothetical protein VF595_05885, partial [Tepidisphaeraceae bacterium]